MPLSEHERQVLLFNLHCAMVPEEAQPLAPVSMPDAIEMIRSVFAAGEATMRIGEHLGDADDNDDDEGGDNVILIRAMSVDRSGIATILLHHGDAAAADPALIHIRNGQIRKAGKKPGEGLAHAAHLLISSKQHLSKSGQSHALLERVPNLGRSTVTAFLNRLLRQKAKADNMTFKEKKDGARPKRCHPKFMAQQQMSHTLKKDLADGKLSHIEFVTRKVADGFEEKNVIVPVTQTISHKIVNAPTGQKAFDLLEKAKSWAKGHNYEEMQIRFRKADTEQHLSPRFATDLADAKDAVYSRFEVLRGFKNPLEQCPQEAVKDVHGKMNGLFENTELWK